LLFKKFIGLKIKQYFFSSPHDRGRRSSLKLLIFILGMIFLVSFAFAQSPAERQTSPKVKLPHKVAILPVKIHSPENLAFMQEGLVDMISSRVELEGRVAVLEKGPVKKAYDQVSGEMNLENARKLGHMLEADFVVFGSLTKLGDSASFDLKVVDVKKEDPGSSVFVQAKKMEEIIARVDDLARKIDEKILGYSLKPQVAERPAEAAKEIGGFPTIPAVSGSIKMGRGVSGGEFWQSQPFPFQLMGMAVGDVDADGRNEVVLIGEKNLYIYRWEKEFKLLWKREGGKLDQYLVVDVADMDQDGKAEIFVTNIQGEKLSSFVVAFKDGAFRTVASGLDWFLRVVEWGEKGTVLLGQQKGYKIGFDRAIYEMGRDGKKYKEIRRADLPKVFSIYGFTPFTHDGKTDYFFIDSDYRLKLMGANGKVTWSSRDDYGSNNVFQAKPLIVGPGYRFEDADELAYVNVRVIPRGRDILVIRNISSTGQLLMRTKSYSKGEIQILTWTGAMFMASWKSQEIQGYLADFQIQDVDKEKGKELIVAINLPTEGFLSGGKNSALMVSRIEGVQ